MATQVFGQLVDDQSRCVHWHSPLDVVALKFKCCGLYFACVTCHAEAEAEAGQHEVRRYHVQQEPTIKVALCGVCKLQMTFNQYSTAEGTKCPSCGAGFNPGCKSHYDLYFDGINNV